MRYLTIDIYLNISFLYTSVIDSDTIVSGVGPSPLSMVIPWILERERNPFKYLC